MPYNGKFFYLGVEIADVIRTCLPIGTCSSIFTTRFLSPSFAVTFSTLLIPLSSLRLFPQISKSVPFEYPDQAPNCVANQREHK